MARVIRFTTRLGARTWGALRRLDDHWIGDLIGGVCLALILWLGFVFVGVLQ